MEHGIKAEQLFFSGCSCAQAVCTAFCDITGLAESDAMRISSSFGGGVGHLREICGAVSGACMVIGMLYGADTPMSKPVKAAQYARVQAVALEFQARYGSYLCRELLQRTDTGPMPEDRTPEYYKSRPCARYCRAAAEILDEYIAAHPIWEKESQHS